MSIPKIKSVTLTKKGYSAMFILMFSLITSGEGLAQEVHPKSTENPVSTVTSIPEGTFTEDQAVVWENVPIDYKIPYFNSVMETDASVVPYAFIVPRQWTSIIQILKAHGIRTQTLRKEKLLRVDSYTFQNVRWPGLSFEGRDTMNYDTKSISEERIFHKGDCVIIMDQRTNRVIMHLLEPKAPDSFV